MSTRREPPVLVLTRKPLRRRRLDRWLADAGGGVCVVGPDSVFGPGDGGLRSRFLAVRTVSDYRSWAVDVAAERLARTHTVGRICSSSEDDVLRAAMLRERLGLPGQPVRSAIAFRDKVIMKTAASAGGVAVPAFAALDGPLELLDFVRAHGLPVVVKPRFGAGSHDVRFVRTDAELTRLLRCGVFPAAPQRNGAWMVERFVDAPLYHVDGLSVGGRLVHGWPSRYSTGNAEATHGGLPLAGVQLDADDPATTRLLGFADAVLSALPRSPHPHSIHLEAWLPAGSSEPVLCEVAARTGGGGVAACHEVAFGVELSRESLRGQAGLPPTPAPAFATPRCCAGWVAFTPRAGVFVRPRDPCPVAGVELEFALESGTRHHGSVHAGDGAATAIVRGESARQTADRVDAVLAWWEEQQPWR